MENPHEERQAVLLERIIKNVDKCNEAIMELNTCLTDIVQSHKETAISSSLFQNYSRNVVYNLEAIGAMGEAK